MQNEGLTPVGTGSWLQVLMLDANRRYSDVNYAAQLQAMPPASVNREIALELASTNYLLTQLLRVGIMHASTVSGPHGGGRRARFPADRAPVYAEHQLTPLHPLQTKDPISMADPAPSTPLHDDAANGASVPPTRWPR